MGFIKLIFFFFLFLKVLGKGGSAKLLLIIELYQHNELKNHYVYTLVFDKC
jgi:hypothetical protein